MIVLFVLIFDLGLVWFYWSRLRTDLKNDTVSEVQGRLEPITALGKYRRYYDLRVKRFQFSIDKQLFELLTEISKDHAYCIVYYAPKSQTILSFESY
jgi:hypothetical protein